MIRPMLNNSYLSVYRTSTHGTLRAYHFCTNRAATNVSTGKENYLTLEQKMFEN